MGDLYAPARADVWNVQATNELRSGSVAAERQVWAFAGPDSVNAQSVRQDERKEPAGDVDLNLSVVRELDSRWHYESAAQKSIA